MDIQTPSKIIKIQFNDDLMMMIMVFIYIFSIIDNEWKKEQKKKR